jgi:hypothetical protein
MQRKYVTKKLVGKMSLLTNRLFKESVIEIMNSPDATEEEITEFLGSIRRLSTMRMLYPEMDEEFQETFKKKELIDELYLNKLIQLSTEDLNNILFLHEHQKPVRAQRTLEIINCELTRRCLLNDSSQSDAIYINGDVHVRQDSKTTSKKASSKKRKTNKDVRVV